VRRSAHTDVRVKYKTYDIVLREDDIWTCHDLDIENEKLSSIKRRIDELNKSERRVNVKALLYETRGWRNKSTITEVTVTVLCEPLTLHGATHETRDCWIINNKTRRKIRIDELMPLSCRAEAKAWLALELAAQLAQKNADAAMDDIQKHDADSLMLESKESASK
jgi:hypothetical protein